MAILDAPRGQSRPEPEEDDPTGLGTSPNQVFYNLSDPALYEQIINRHEAQITAGGAVNALTGEFTGRSPSDKFIVREPDSERHIAWGGFNTPMEPEQFAGLRQQFAGYLHGRDLFVQDLHAGADPAHRIRVRVVSELAWHGLFARNLLIRPAPDDLIGFVPDFTIVDAARFQASPERDSVRSSTVIAVSFAERLVLIGGTEYAGEIKKAVFSILNYLLPLRDTLPMHCSANLGPDGDVALFFGLSGTGKTTLSADSARQLIGDDEHGWSERGIFNFEGGCYAKVIRLSERAEPEIFATTRRFGTVLENVVVPDGSRVPDLDSEQYTENTRAAYPIDFIPNAVIPGVAGHPTTILFLAADAFGVLPPIARLTPDQAMYHFLSGYTAQVAGTERGLGDEPKATFSTCFAAPFLPMPGMVYARMLGEMMTRHNVRCYLVNTGWTGGPYHPDRRMPIALTRSLVRAALDGTLDKVEHEIEPFFGLNVPVRCPTVPEANLNARSSWADPAAYDKQARQLASMFVKNFAQFDDVDPAVKAAGPRV